MIPNKTLSSSSLNTPSSSSSCCCSSSSSSSSSSLSCSVGMPNTRDSSPLVSPSSPPSPPSLDESSKTIFISVAAYRDIECQHTVYDALAKAEFPFRVHIGIVWQYDAVEDQDLFDHCPKWSEYLSGPNQIRQLFLDYKQARGPVYARALCQKRLFQDEDYFLQIDSHIRFAPKWDTQLINMLNSCSSEKPIISTYSPGYEVGQPIPNIKEPTHLCACKFGDDGMLRIMGKTLKKQPHRPIPGKWWAAGFSFSRGAFVREVPNDPHLKNLFFGEEVSMTARMYTHGWDLFTPTHNVIYHLWSKDYRPSFREALMGKSVHQNLERRARLYVKRLLRMKDADTDKLEKLGIITHDEREDDELIAPTKYDYDLIHPVLNSKSLDTRELYHEYGLGRVRSMDEFELHTGVNFRTQVISERGALGGLSISDFQPDQEQLGIIWNIVQNHSKGMLAGDQFKGFSDMLASKNTRTNDSTTAITINNLGENQDCNGKELKPQATLSYTNSSISSPKSKVRDLKHET